MVKIENCSETPLLKNVIDFLQKEFANHESISVKDRYPDDEKNTTFDVYNQDGGLINSFDLETLELLG